MSSTVHLVERENIMATITNTQLQFSSNNISTGNYHFPTGTVSLFFLSSAPSEWSQVTSQNNKAFRVVSGTGGGAGGNQSFTGCLQAETLVLTLVALSTVPTLVIML